MAKKRKTTAEFIVESKAKYGDNFDYSKTEYKGANELITVTCKVHGDITKCANQHLRYGCKQCGIKSRAKTRTYTNDTFIEKANGVHGDKYDYSKVKYTKASEKVTIICKEHGEFKQAAQNHLKGQGCPKCGFEICGGWDRDSFVTKADGRECICYFIRIFNDTEEFYKIGITSHSTKHRFYGAFDMPYEYEVLHEIKGSAGFIFDTEAKYHKMHKGLEYTPKIDFPGSVKVCFTNLKKIKI